MPRNIPLGTTGAHTKRPGRVPKGVRAALKAFVWEGATLEAASAIAGLTIDTLQRWLKRPEVIAAIREERRAFFGWIVGTNAQALAAIRDLGSNDYARVRAVQLLEEMAGERKVPGGPQVNVNNQVNALSALPPDYRFPPGYRRGPGYTYASCDRPEPKTIEAVREVERPPHQSVIEHRQRVEQHRLEDEARRRQEERDGNPVFTLPFMLD